MDIIYFRVDCDSKIGFGHVSRCIALCEMFNNLYYCVFIIKNPNESTKKKIKKVCYDIITFDKSIDKTDDARYVSHYLKKKSGILILDGYDFDINYQKTVMPYCKSLISIDDTCKNSFVSDFIINHSLNLNDNINIKDIYKSDPYTQIVYGVKYSILRDVFIKVCRSKIPLHFENNIFICLGAADPKNITLQVIKKCMNILKFDKLYVVVGNMNPNKEVLENFTRDIKKVNLIFDLNEYSMLEYMKKSNIAITSPSTISYEYLCVGGQLLLLQTEENQTNIYKFLISSGYANDFKNLNSLGTSLERNVRFSPTVFDGNQKKRLIKIITTSFLDSREANFNDIKIYFDWSNDKETRKNSYNNENISFEDHKVWFNEKIESPDSHLILIMKESIPIGQVRFQDNKEHSIISFSVDRKFRGKRLGESILRKGVLSYFKIKQRRNTLIGYVKKENLASMKVFLSFGFKEKISHSYKNSYKYILK